MSGKTWATIDVETTMNSPIGNAATPFHPSNKVVLAGLKRGDTSFPIQWEPRELVTGEKVGVRSKNDISLLIGHNIGFDIHHCRKSGEWDEGFLGTNLWDTQLAEYLLSGQTHTYPSLDDLTAKYVGPVLKDKAVTAVFDSGLGADHVPMHILKPYHKEDILNTEAIFIRQFQEAEKLGMVPLINTQMDALAATIDMTYNGLKVDTDKLMRGVAKYQKLVEEYTTDLVAFASTLGIEDFNPSSPKQMSLLLFGGELSYTENVCIGKYKNGKDKFQKQTKSKPIKGMFPSRGGTLNAQGYYSTDESVLTNLPKTRITEGILKLRDYEKQLGTYWEGLLKLVMPDGFIHHRINHCVTRTGRLSSSEPNMQNITNGEVKQVFVSRWGNDGVLLEADFKQLEMVELALRSMDAQLIHDIQNGVDMHDALFLEMYGRPMKKEERKNFKRCSFALVYGAGAGGIAAQTGISKEEAKRFINTFYSRYKGVASWHNLLVGWARENRQKSDKKTASGKPAGKAVYVCGHTNRRYTFYEYDAPEWLKADTSFSPTELKNYMVQGGATGDKVPLMVGVMRKVLRNRPDLKDKCLMVNTVHDSILFDVHKDVLWEAAKLIKQTLENLPHYYKEAFGVSLALPFKVEVSAGPNWLDQKEIDFGSMSYKEAA